MNTLLLTVVQVLAQMLPTVARWWFGRKIREHRARAAEHEDEAKEQEGLLAMALEYIATLSGSLPTKATEGPLDARSDYAKALDGNGGKLPCGCSAGDVLSAGCGVFTSDGERRNPPEVNCAASEKRGEPGYALLQCERCHRHTVPGELGECMECHHVQGQPFSPGYVETPEGDLHGTTGGTPCGCAIEVIRAGYCHTYLANGRRRQSAPCAPVAAAGCPRFSGQPLPDDAPPPSGPRIGGSAVLR